MNPSLSANNAFNCSCKPPAANVARTVATLLRASFPAHADLNARHTIDPALTCLLRHDQPGHAVCSPQADLATYIHMVRHACNDHVLARTAFEALEALRDSPGGRRGLVDVFMSNGMPECLGDILAKEAKPGDRTFSVGCVNFTYIVTYAALHAVWDDDKTTVALALALWEHGVPENACAILAEHDDHEQVVATAVSLAFHSFEPFVAVRRPEGSPLPTLARVGRVCEALLGVACHPGVSDAARRRAILTLRLICNTGERSFEHPLWLLLSDDFVRFMPLLVAVSDTVGTPDSPSVTSFPGASFYLDEPLDSYRELAYRLLCACCLALRPPSGQKLFAEPGMSHLEGTLAQILRASAPNGGTDLPGLLFGPPLHRLPPAQRVQYRYVAPLLESMRDSTTNGALREACTAFLGHAGWVRTRCGNPACPTHESADKLKICARCQVENYCGEACQKSDWPRHKKACKK